MKLKLSQNAYGILKHVLAYTGEKEMNQDGKEIMSPRRLSGEDGAQRRFYFKAIDPLLKSAIDEKSKFATQAIEKYKKENKKEKGETEEKYNERVAKTLNSDGNLLLKVNAPLMKPLEVELTDKTAETIKKYFKEYGDTNGWTAADDATIEEIENNLK